MDTEASILLFPDAKSWLIGKDPDPGKDWGQEQKGATEDKMVGWHHQLNGYGLSNPKGERRMGKTGVLQFMGSQRIRHDWSTKQQHIFLIKCLLMPITNFYSIAFLVLWNIVEYSRTRTYPSETSRKYTLLMPSKHNVSCEFLYHHEILWLVLQFMGWLFLLTPFYFTQAQSCSHHFVSGDL